MLLALSVNDLLTPLALFGFAGQLVFMARFVLQWFVSERRGRSYVPVGFWYLSLAGGIMLMIYATLRQDPVFMFGQLLGLVIYVRNLMLIHRRRSRLRRALDQRAAQLAEEDMAPGMLGELGVSEDEGAAADAVVTGR
jgi:lipid-A-disaccharide synthase-like uncharacterized protein